MPIVWHAESGTFFVGTKHDSSIFRGRPDDPSVRVFLEGQPGQAAAGIGIAGERILVAGAEYGDIRVYDLQTRQRVGEFSTGPGTCLMGMHVTEAGDVWVTDAFRPVLWHLTADQSRSAAAHRPRCPSARRSRTSAHRTTSKVWSR